MERLYLLGALEKLGALGVEQLERLLFDTGLTPAFELLEPLLALQEQGFVTLALSQQGVIYAITPEGSAQYEKDAAEHPDVSARIAAKATEYSGALQMEKDYLAQYSEQSSGIVPVFLSIREGSKIIMKVSLIVHDVRTAKIIADHWVQNASATYGAVWENISEGEPMPEYWSRRPQ